MDRAAKSWGFQRRFLLPKLGALSSVRGEGFIYQPLTWVIIESYESFTNHFFCNQISLPKAIPFYRLRLRSYDMTRNFAHDFLNIEDLQRFVLFRNACFHFCTLVAWLLGWARQKKSLLIKTIKMIDQKHLVWLNKNQHLHIQYLQRYIIFHQPICRGAPLPQLPFGVRSCGFAIIWKDSCFDNSWCKKHL